MAMPLLSGYIPNPPVTGGGDPWVAFLGFIGVLALTVAIAGALVYFSSPKSKLAGEETTPKRLAHAA